MALVGQSTSLCHDGFAGDGVLPFMDAPGIAFGYGYDDYHYQPHLLEEECLLGSGAWELPTGVLGAEQPGDASAFDGHDFGWAHATGVSSPASVLTFHDPTATAASASHKRPRAHAQAQQGSEQESGGNCNPKRQCGGDRKAATKPRKTSGSTSPPKDPTSDAAKNRRERIGERLRALQELVPNGTKVDMVTMLDKAITYVKFMQLQLTVLETDAFWPAQGGEAPEISQVKAALDAIILSSSQQNHQRS
uniref:Uncharacterized protein n=1 Tax=Avena sativa TaxID=4498 RepID=A0ACD5VC53_AVESA